MYLLYLDESGNPDGKDDRYFVIGGIALFERRVYWMNEAIEELADRLFPGASIEFHAHAMQQHGDEPWRSMPSETRKAALDGLCKIVTDSHAVLFAVALDKSLSTEPVARAFEEVCNRFDLFLGRLHFQGDEQRGLIIFDETRYEPRLQNLLMAYRVGTRFGKRVKNFADVPFFADSKATRMLQVADLISYAVYRRYERADSRWLDRIITKFDTDNQIIHGLVHLCRDKGTCHCPACLTRRLASQQPPTSLYPSQEPLD